MYEIAVFVLRHVIEFLSSPNDGSRIGLLTYKGWEARLAVVVPYTGNE
jgi:hypothetical protein